MGEVISICIVVVVMFVGLWLLGWCYGDFRKPQGTPPQPPSV